MAESWTGIAVGLFGLTSAVLLVAAHYRRELIRRRQLRQMDHRHCWDVMQHRR
ncbi:hypothetical protein AB3X96_41425 [Paraburkholderia sp. BR13439]|uniref:hypothetical protein n=1 Tax=unclassified Paraburkholderia TaxID=2615204 RepID=UPI0034CD8D8A